MSGLSSTYSYSKFQFRNLTPAIRMHFNMYKNDTNSVSKTKSL